MKLEKTLQGILDNYGFIYPNRESALLYLYCCYGTGYEWVNGELVAPVIACNNKVKSELKENEKAKQNKSDYEIIVKNFIYGVYFENNISYEEMFEFIPKENEIDYYIQLRSTEKLQEKSYCKEDAINKVKCAMAEVYKKSEEKICSLRKGAIESYIKMLNKNNSPLFNLPNNIKDDWKQGADEVICLLKDKYRVNLEKI